MSQLTFLQVYPNWALQKVHSFIFCCQVISLVSVD